MESRYKDYLLMNIIHLPFHNKEKNEYLYIIDQSIQVEVIKVDWTTPKLTILVRSKSEELVLTYCKGGSTDGASMQYGICQVSNCEFACNTINTS